MFIRKENASDYIGKNFKSENGEATLDSVDITKEYTRAYSPVTQKYLCYYVNGMLSIPGGIEKIVNIFEVDGETMTINYDKYNEDIAEYGEYTYEEFCEIVEIPTTAFEAFNGRYLKVAVGKGLITENDIIGLVERYSNMF